MSGYRYDNFRAPQYVDFANLGSASSDESSYFDRTLENNALVPTGDPMDDVDDVDMSVTSDISDSLCDTTLTPVKNDLEGVPSPLTPWPNEKKSGGAHTVSSVLGHASATVRKTSISQQSSPGKPSMDKNLFNAIKSGGNSEESPFHPVPRVQRNGWSSTPMNSNLAHHSARQSRASKTPCHSDVQINIIPPSPNVSFQSSSHDTSCKSVKLADESFKTGRGRPSNISSHRRRSRSTGGNQSDICVWDESAILEDAMHSLQLSSNIKVNPGGSGSLPPQEIANCIPTFNSGEKTPHTSSKAAIKQTKRRLSPVPRDYSRQPEKYISLAEQIVRNDKQIPSRFRSTSRAGVIKKAVHTKLVRNTATSKKETGCSSDLKSSEVQIGTQNQQQPNKGVKVARWPSPKIEPFVLTEYKKDQHGVPPKTMFDFSKGQVIPIRDRRTPIKKLRPPTKTEPFSFDKRDQEIIQRKLARARGECDYKLHCKAERRLRRRSKSQGDEICQAAEERVHHARAPLVLYKPPFIPQKANQKPTRPLNLELNTEKRAREREQFNEHVRSKEENRKLLLEMQQEKKRQEEEKELMMKRKELVYKAHPMPAYNMFTVKPSSARLTDPVTPPFLHRTKKHKSLHDPSE